jgi:hypothetical protein
MRNPFCSPLSSLKTFHIHLFDCRSFLERGYSNFRHVHLPANGQPLRL